MKKRKSGVVVVVGDRGTMLKVITEINMELNICDYLSSIT